MNKIETINNYKLVYDHIGEKQIELSRDFKLNLTNLYYSYKLYIIGKSGTIYNVECIYIHCYIYRITITQISKNFLFVNSDFKEPLDLFY